MPYSPPFLPFPNCPYALSPHKYKSLSSEIAAALYQFDVTRLDGSKWEAGVGCGSEKGTDGKNISTRFIRIDKNK